ncbi:MAG: ankyrin repeat domain-containing protein [Kiloniellales bacterium]|nr:ankyrin repeat domain-containing protein [Kiloniellales bacterium]
MRHLCTILVAVLFAIATAQAGPLHEAALKGDTEAAKGAVEAGAQLQEVDESGEPPLLIAALAGHKEVVVLLLDAGADIHAGNKGGLTALHAAAYGGHADIVRVLIARGAVVNQSKNFYQMSPLHAAAEEGHAEVVALLLDEGAEIEAKERNGYTPLTQAGWREYWDTADLLMKAGATCQPADLVGDWLHEECSKRQ